MQLCAINLYLRNNNASRLCNLKNRSILFHSENLGVLFITIWVVQNLLIWIYYENKTINESFQQQMTAKSALLQSIDTITVITGRLPYSSHILLFLSLSTSLVASSLSFRIWSTSASEMRTIYESVRLFAPSNYRIHPAIHEKVS